jgi:hypothetical protein
MTELCDIATKHGTDKAPWHWGYTRIYAEWVPRDISTVLEIGIFQGASLRTWREYFVKARIFGIDVDAHCQVTDDDQIKTFCMNAYDVSMLLPILQEQIGPIDFFVDDALHKPDLQIAMLRVVWPFISPGGIYSIEDIFVAGDKRDLRKVEAAIGDLPGVAKWQVWPGKEDFSMVILRKA